MKRAIVKKIEKVIVDFDNPNAYKEKPLSSYPIPLREKSRDDEIGKFKIRIEESEDFFGGHLAYKDKAEVLYFFCEGKFINVFSNYLYKFEKEFDHGKEREYTSEPLQPFIYFDLKDRVYFLEDKEGTLYCSVDGKRWFMQLLKPEKRLYAGKIKRLVKTLIEYEQ